MQVVVEPPRIALALRANIGEWHYVRVNVEDLGVEIIDTSQYLAFKERLAGKMQLTCRPPNLGGNLSSAAVPWRTCSCQICHATAM